MVSSASPKALDDLEAAVVSSYADRAVDAAVAAFQKKVPPKEVLLAAARASALHFDPALGRPPHGLLALSAATNLLPHLKERFHPLPVLQAVALAAGEKKSLKPARPALVVRGEISHLGRSFVFAARDGNLPEAEAIFLGLVDERHERRMAGDMLFRAAIEDMGDGGHKLVTAVGLWRLVRALGFKDARTLLRPAVQYLAAGPRDGSRYRAMMDVLGKEWVDLERLASAGRPLDAAAHKAVSAVLASDSEEACVSRTLTLLEDGAAAASVAEALVAEASRRLLAADSYDLDAIHGLLHAHAAHFVLTFSRTSEGLYALFQAALRLRSSPPAPFRGKAKDAPGEGEELCEMAGELERSAAESAAARVSSYLGRGFSGPRLIEVLANYACRDAAMTNEGHTMALADACAAEFTASGTPEVAMALASGIAATPRDWTAYEVWKGLLGP